MAEAEAEGRGRDGGASRFWVYRGGRRWCGSTRLFVCGKTNEVAVSVSAFVRGSRGGVVLCCVGCQCNETTSMM